MSKIVDILTEEPKEYLTMLSHELDKGISFPKAREKALLMCLGDIATYSPILSSSNDILAIEYLKAIKQTKSSILPIPIKRQAVEYNSLEPNGNFASATAIRKMVTNRTEFEKFMPEKAYSIFTNEIKYGRFVDDISKLSQIIFYKLRTMSIEEIANLPDVSEGLQFRIRNAAETCNDLDTLISSIKTKRYTLTRIYRILLYALLDITKEDIIYSHKITPYIRILGVSESGKQLLKELSKKKKVKVITSIKKFLDKTKPTNSNLPIINILNIDILATNIYTLGYEYDSQSNLDYTKKIVSI